MADIISVEKYFDYLVQGRQIGLKTHKKYALHIDSINKPPRNMGSTSLMYAAYSGNYENVQKILQIENENQPSLSRKASTQRLSMSALGQHTFSTSGRRSLTPNIVNQTLLDTIQFYSNSNGNGQLTKDLLGAKNSLNQTALDFACFSPKINKNIIKALLSERKLPNQGGLSDIQYLLLNQKYTKFCDPEIWKMLLPNQFQSIKTLLKWGIQYCQNYQNIQHVRTSFLPEFIGTLWYLLILKNQQTTTYPFLRYLVQFIQVHLIDIILQVERKFDEKPLTEYMTSLVCQNIQFEFRNVNQMDLFNYCEEWKLNNLKVLIKRYPYVKLAAIENIGKKAKKSPVFSHLYEKPERKISTPLDFQLPLFNLVGIRK